MAEEVKVFISEYDDMWLYIPENFFLGSDAYYELKDYPDIVYKGKIMYLNKYSTDLVPQEYPIDVDATGEFILNDGIYYVGIKKEEEIAVDDINFNIVGGC